MKIGLFANRFNYNALPYLNQLVQALQTNAFQVVVCSELYELTKLQITYPDNVRVIQEDHLVKEEVGMLVCLGGDGTLLSAIQYIKNTNIPVIGINTGRLGFLASISKEDIDRAVEMIRQKRFVYDQRVLLQVETTPGGLFSDLNFALNELTIHKNDSASMITIHTYIDGQYLNSYWADGLIVSTPTGSTAYSLACGGPIVMADSDTFLITPIAPHNLNVRPIVISDKKKILLKVEGRSQNFMVSLDSRSSYIDSGYELLVSRAPFTINLVKLEGSLFFETIRNKLLWGIDRRN